ncbi:valine--tRNA ligase [Bacteriovorax stolpii]|uniref:valine--tRNA ligase n=1 Tax=Bacteriovorax stolpii TaxID=960 RepID=UPI0011591E5B|nr:valine--tRNA ligase [Bacteriovorax stolpii]QDK43309.1 valine--tRNA ligase [Bacteriovorax stolpii]
MTTNTTELATTYSPADVETKWYKTWEDGKYFKPKKGKANKPFCIIVPPPNVTGKLHAGHALDITTQDSLIRFKRMKGFETLLLPGLDHAGISTQSVVEKMVFEQEKKTRRDFSREEFVKKIWAWKEEYGNHILNQQRAMGTSCDWDYLTFTLDPIPNKAVKKFFVDMYNQKMIYQSDYIVNWDPMLQSAVSDAEVEHKDVQGNFFHIKYAIKGSEDFLEVATTRPETLFGDTAVAVNPNDERFKHLIGKTAIVPLCNREVPIIGDEHVDLEKGTGCLKVTPGHDFNDFEIGKRHNLPIINILNKDGTMNEEGLEFKGLAAKVARNVVSKKLEELGLLLDKKPHMHPVGHGERSGVPIEPMISKQWFVNVTDMSRRAVEAVENGNMKFYPKEWENTYYSWLRNPKDWCISRQLWWGHQIPVFYCDNNHQWASEHDETECPTCKSKNVHQDPDVLDTWFSSGLWPMSTLGWPDPKAMEEKKFSTFFPTSVLITGYDIIFFWVARMMMMSLQTQNQVPFKDTYIHAIVRDKLGRKMSKSLGNGIDPFDMIAQYGTDAFRFTLAAGSGYNRNINLDPDRIGGYRNFINKVWNAFRFIYPHLQTGSAKINDMSKLDHHERWILAELNTTAKLMNESMEVYRYDDASAAIYSFVYDKYCSWFIELSKNILNGSDEAAKARRVSVLKFAFRKILALMHPLTPFITEELWSYLKEANEDLLIAQEYPEYDAALEFKEDQDQMNKFVEVTTAIRNLRASVNIKPKDEVNVELFTDNQDLITYFRNNFINFQELARVKDLKVGNKELNRPNKSIVNVLTHTEIFLPLDGVIDLTEQISRLEKELTKTKADYAKYEAKMKNENFMKNAPENVRAEVIQNERELGEKIASLMENIAQFKS